MKFSSTNALVCGVLYDASNFAIGKVLLRIGQSTISIIVPNALYNVVGTQTGARVCPKIARKIMRRIHATFAWFIASVGRILWGVTCGVTSKIIAPSVSSRAATVNVKCDFPSRIGPSTKRTIANIDGSAVAGSTSAEVRTPCCRKR